MTPENTEKSTDRPKGDRPRRPYGKSQHGGGGRGAGGRKDFRKRDGQDRRPRDRDWDSKRSKPVRTTGGQRSYRGRDDRRGGYGKARRDGDRRPGSERAERRPAEAKPEPPKEMTLTVPSTPQKILFKGIDCEVNGRSDLAMYLYLHGAALLSGGCESNALRMLSDMGPREFPTVRGRVAKNCDEDCLIVFDYLCSTIDASHDRSLLESASAAGSPLATYCRIRLEEVDGEDPLVDAFAASVEGNEAMVEDGLKLLVRKKDSAKAEAHLENLKKRRSVRQTIRPTFIRAMKGEKGSRSQLESLSKEFPEAGFLLGYLDAEDRETYLREGMPRFRDTVLSLTRELGISDTPYGMFLVAKKLQADGEEWIPSMVNAVGAGSEDAMDELRPVQNRKDVRKSLASVYLERMDAAGLVRCYDGEDTYALDRYCAGDPQRVLEVGRLMGGLREIDWLKKGHRDGVAGCGDALIAMVSDKSRRSKQLVYALHDIGAEKEAGRLYMDMYGDPSLPSVKWLAKVCADEEARELVRARFEEMGDLRTFESIFVDDGYDRKHRGGGRPSGRSGGFQKKGGKGRR